MNSRKMKCLPKDKSKMSPFVNSVDGCVNLQRFFNVFLESIKSCVERLQRSKPELAHFFDHTAPVVTFTKIGAVLTLFWASEPNKGGAPEYDGMYITVDLVPMFKAQEDLDLSLIHI